MKRTLARLQIGAEQVGAIAFAALFGVFLALLAVPASAALRPGAVAPDFTTRGAVAGKVMGSFAHLIDRVDD